MKRLKIIWLLVLAAVAGSNACTTREPVTVDPRLLDASPLEARPAVTAVTVRLGPTGEAFLPLRDGRGTFTLLEVEKSHQHRGELAYHMGLVYIATEPVVRIRYDSALFEPQYYRVGSDGLDLVESAFITIDPPLRLVSFPVSDDERVTEHTIDIEHRPATVKFRVRTMAHFDLVDSGGSRHDVVRVEVSPVDLPVAAIYDFLPGVGRIRLESFERGFHFVLDTPPGGP